MAGRRNRSSGGNFPKGPNGFSPQHLAVIRANIVKTLRKQRLPGEALQQAIEISFRRLAQQRAIDPKAAVGDTLSVNVIDTEAPSLRTMAVVQYVIMPGGRVKIIKVDKPNRNN